MNNNFIISILVICVLVEISISVYYILLYFNKKINVNFSQGRTTFWWEPWSYHTYNINLASTYNPWDLYTKYRLSIWNSWHILEDRICLFAIYIYVFLL